MNDTLYTNLADAVNSAVTRRKFMQLTGIGAGSILGGSLLAKLQAVAAPPIGATDGVLVMIYLGGGNDLLNTLVPYTNNTYRNLRPNLHLFPEAKEARNKCIPIDNQWALHSSLANLSNLYSQGKVAFLPGVGFDGQDLSHFTSQASYMGGWLGDGKAATGWAGRFLDTFDDAAQENTRGLTINGAMPLALQGAISSPISLPSNISSSYFATSRQGHEPEQHCISHLRELRGDPSSVRADVVRGLHGALDLPNEYGDAYVNLPSNISSIERNLAIAASTINANLGARVIHVTLGGFDTHVNQLNDHAAQLAALDKAIGTFFSILSAQFANRVTLMTYSEFGRRAQENGTGTDHGRAALMTLIGNNVKPGILSDFPSMSSLDNSGNLTNTVDFRKIYGEISSSWLKTDQERIVGQSYAPLGLFTSGPGGSTISNPVNPPQQTPTTSTTGPTTTTTKPTTTTSTRPTTTTTRPTTTTTTTMPGTRPPTTTTTRPAPTTTTTMPGTRPPTKPVPEITEEQVVRFILRLIRRWLKL